FLYSTIFTIWIIILCIRKGLYLRSIGDRAAQAHFIYATVNASYVCGTITSVFFGIYSIAGYWTYFLFIWFGSLASIVLYIVFAAVPASFQTKITGFTYVLAATLLTIITLILYPPSNTAIMTEQLARHKGLLRLLFLIILIAMLIVTLMPFMLKISITRPLQRLLEGVQNVNQGKLETQVPVGLKDEIGLLTQNFNRMTQSLKKSKDDLTDYAQTLEKKVSKRTAQLQQSLNELRSTQAQLIQSEKMASLGELTAGIAHEIQNPLNFVNNFSDLNTELIKEMKLELEVGNKEESIAISNIVANNEQKINHHGKRAEAIVKGMLQHSKTSGKKELTDINALAHNYLRLTYHDLRAKDQSFNATMQTDFDQNIEKINIIPQDIGKVLLNLFTNAFYSVTEKKKQQGDAFEPNVSISTKKLDDKIEIRVIDNGNGIPENVLDKIFQPFFTTKPAGQGTGLGLSLSYDIITKGHGGHIKVKTKEGEFTEFIIQLPGNSK
ncbi:MAG TPA: ATP-binding protein, partial [Chitinophagaceae bacterium]|nr:ATP-binding protein [Chitinophagaceae bacterium]